MRYFNFLSLFILIFSLSATAQDSLKTLNSEEILQIVRKFHPIGRQTEIEIEMSKADILIARSAFDPVLNMYSSHKKFDGTTYYNSVSPEFNIPTWYGIEIFGGLENVTGDRLDPSQTVGQTSYFGVSVSLIKDLVINKQMAFIKQAKIFANLAANQKRAVMNDLLMNATEAYWNWVRAYQTYIVLKNNVITNEKRLEMVKKSFINGERPSIDTVEALIQLQNFQYQQNNYYLEFKNAGLELSAYLWKSNNEPYWLPESVIPQGNWENEAIITSFNLSLPNLLVTANENHPELKAYSIKFEILYVNKKAKFQELLPRLDFRYNQLGKGYNILETATTTPLFENNYQYGLKFEMPLRLSQGRGEYKKAKLKIEDNTLQQNQKSYQIQLKISSYFNEYLNLKSQVALQSSNYQNNQQLVRAEETRFFNGESSVFLINSRENKALESLEKLIDLKTKYYKTLYALQWSAGILY